MGTKIIEKPETTIDRYLQMCRIIQFALVRDYANSGKDAYQGNMNKHQALIASTFDLSKWDSNFIKVINRFFAEFKDRQLKLLVKDTKYYQNFSRGFRVRHFGDALFVTEVTAENCLTPGDKITSLDGKSFSETYERVKGWLFNDTPEREIWNGILKSTDQVTVEHVIGSQEIISLKKYPPESDRYDNTFTWLSDDVAYFKLQNEFDERGIFHILEENKTHLSKSKKLILDLRRNIGGSEAAFYPLLPYLLDRPASIVEIREYPGGYTNYSKDNCSYLVKDLEQYLQTNDPEQAAFVKEMIEDIRKKSGKGFRFEADEVSDFEREIIHPINPSQKVFLLLDTFCENAGELFAEICAKLPKVTIIGRPSMGCTDHTNLIVRELNPFYSLVYPITRSAKVDEGRGLNGKGVPVDVYIPWTPEECSRDLLLENACEI